MVSTGFDSILPTRIGAIDSYVYDISKRLSQWHLIDLYGRGAGYLEEGRLRIHGFSYYFPESKYVRLRESAYSLQFNARIVNSVMKLQKHNPVDVFHVNTVYATFAAKLVKGLFKVPTVCSFHNTSLVSFFAGSCDKILANSNYMKEFLIKERGFKPEKVDVLPIAVDVNAYKPNEIAKAKLNLQNREVILFVGRKCQYKGPQVLIDALPDICRKHPKALAVLLGPDFAFGEGSNLYSTFLLKLAERNNILSQVSIKSYVPEETLKMYFNAADVVVVPSIWQEPFGKVAIEALACEKPVVASNVGALPELVQNGINGLIVPPNNPTALAGAVSSLLSDKKLSKRMGLEGRKLVESNYSYEVAVAKCQQIYAQLV
jgi:spore coat protein SA